MTGGDNTRIGGLGNTTLADLKTDLDTLSTHDPMLADLINNRLSVLTEIENQKMEGKI
jgi:hypothetical protein